MTFKIRNWEIIIWNFFVGVFVLSSVLFAEETPVTEADIVRAVSEQDYVWAVRLAEKALKTDAPEADILFFKGFSELRLGETKEGLESLQRYLDFGGGQYKQEARKLVHQMSPNRLDLYKMLQVGVGYDSRVTVVKNLTVKHQDDFALRARLNLRALHESGAVAEYKLYWLQYDQAHERSQLEQRIELGSAFALGKTVIEWRILGESDLEDNKELLYEYGARTEASWLMTKNSVLKLGVEGGQDQFAQNSNFDANYAKASSLVQYFKDPWIFWMDTYGYWNITDRDSLSFFEYGGGLSGLYQASKAIGLGLSLRGARLEYEAYDSVKNVHQKDTFFSSRTWISYAITKNTVLAPSWQYIHNDSNYSLNDYNETVVAIDMIFKF